jgi:hypothetical protein
LNGYYIKQKEGERESETEVKLALRRENIISRTFVPASFTVLFTISRFEPYGDWEGAWLTPSW